MLDKYKIGQPIAYNILINAINNNRISHAYLFDSNGNSDVNDIVLSFVKMILCKDFSSSLEIKNICDRIDSGNYLDIIFLEPDGMWIKKEQLINLQSEFSKKSIEGSKKIYIIKEADKMNLQTANSILKFLEEPVDDIIAILITDNINLILPTILSRCQIIKLNKKVYTNCLSANVFDFILNNNFSLEDKNKIIDCCIDFVMNIEKNGIDTLIYTKKLWHNFFKDRNYNIIAIEIIINFYYDVIKYKSDLNISFFSDKIKFIEEVANKNSFVSIASKIEILDNIKNGLKSNLNINLLIDKMIIDMCGDNL